MDEVFVVTRTWAGVMAAVVLVLFAAMLHLATKARGLPNDKRPAHLKHRRRGIKGLVIGTDGRASTSKVQAVIWTAAVLYAFLFLLLWGRSTDCGDADHADRTRCVDAAVAREAFTNVVEGELDPEYYVLMGFPLAAAVAARAITASKEADGMRKPKLPEDTKGVVQGLSEVVSNDQGDIDLIDLQYFAFNLLTLAFFFSEFLTRPQAGLPDLPATLIALSGVSAGVYTARKALARP